MKYANLRYAPRKERLNLGDDMQLLAVDNIYRFMGIADEDVINIDYGDLATYNGDYAVLPIAFPLLAYTKNGDITCFSDRIIPVFLSVCILAPTLSEKDVAYLKRFAPIGCRDAHTLGTMRSYGIPSYLNGCITLGFPKRWSGGNGKVYIVDIPERMMGAIPSDLRKKAVITSQIRYKSTISIEPKVAIAKLYEEYIAEAQLVITSRMHCALPCFAAGVPTVFMKDVFSYRFAGIDALVPIYTKEEYPSIDWNPKPLDLEAHKKEMLGLCVKRLRDAFERYHPFCSLSVRLEDHERPSSYYEYIHEVKSDLQEEYASSGGFDCIIWGATQTASLVFAYIKDCLPGVKIQAIIDNGLCRTFCGYNTVPMDCVDTDVASPALLIVCAASAVQDARMFAKKNKVKKVLFCCDAT